jgi:mRNA-degrading endonuclease RelE of RelBE toxin-antitoxin system
LRIKGAIDKIQEKPKLGKPLQNELAGFLSEHVGKFRIVYQFDEKYVYLITCRKRKKGY